MAQTNSDIKAYFVTIPAHKFLHIRNYESIGYYDFWEKQSHIPGQDCATICGLLDSIKGKLDEFSADIKIDEEALSQYRISKVKSNYNF